MVGLLFFSVFRYECRGTGYWMSRHPCLELQAEFFKVLECRGIGYSMLRHWVFWLPKKISLHFRMSQHWVLNVVALAFLTCFHFSAFIPMPRHWTMNAITPMVQPKFKLQVLIWMPRHWILNATALMSRPKLKFLCPFECRDIHVWMPWHWGFCQNECRDTHVWMPRHWALFLYALIFNFSTWFLLISWPKQTYKLQDEDK